MDLKTLFKGSLVVTIETQEGNIIKGSSVSSKVGPEEDIVWVKYNLVSCSSGKEIDIEIDLPSTENGSIEDSNRIIEEEIRDNEILNQVFKRVWLQSFKTRGEAFEYLAD